ncbi:hypothetical protein MAR_013799 [Mya arenaria]|uniref:Uncharacterized protein n=1 Tax=Mya arenaria TaxID=6604 RepID=A0ABY7G1I9_MYAAR|nr:hypothetical protein MAR_013799 [Mya arenaria]
MVIGELIDMSHVFAAHFRHGQNLVMFKSKSLESIDSRHSSKQKKSKKKKKRRSRSHSRSPERAESVTERGQGQLAEVVTQGHEAETGGEGAAADEKIKGDTQRISSATSLQDSMAFSQAIQDIESTGFSAATFKSSRGDHKDGSTDRDEFVFGTAGELRLDSHRKPVILDIDKEDLAHPSLYSDPEERMERWVQRLTQLRRKKLEGEALA